MKYFTALLTLSILFLIGCTSNLETEKQQIDKETQMDNFWTWFQDHSDELFEFENNQDQLFAQLTTELNKIDKNLTFEFGMVKDDYTREFIISADGITSSFEAVEQLCDAAPNMKGWVVIAFRPRIGTEFAINYDGIVIDGERMKFTYLPAGDVIDIELFVPNYDANDDRYITAAFILLDGALGEYDVETKLGGIEFLPVPNDTTSLLPFSELPHVVDNFGK